MGVFGFASIIAGGPAPLIAAWLSRIDHSSYAIAHLYRVCAVTTLAAPQ
jgi:hypothetical protein